MNLAGGAQGRGADGLRQQAGFAQCAAFRAGPLAHAYAHAYAHAHALTYLLTYLRTCLLSDRLDLQTAEKLGLRCPSRVADLLAYLLTYLPAYLLTYLPADR